MFSVIGFSFTGSAPNQGLIFTLLKPFEERQRPRAARSRRMLPRLRGPLFGIQGGLVIPFAPPSIQPRHTSAASRSRCSIRAGGADIQNLGRAARRR